MAAPLTEAQHEAAHGLDALPAAEIAGRLHRGQMAALATAKTSIETIALAGVAMAETIRAGGNLIYAAAGSSALMALADAAELPGTYGIAPDQVHILMAGGLPVDANMPGATEDDTAEAAQAAQTVNPGDLVIALSASGTTPYPLTIAKIARHRGAKTVCIVNNAGAAMLEFADIAICVATPPELIAGSTRMGAGTAQKAVLNMMSTLMGVHLGHVHDGMMVNVHADNAKLRKRAVAMIGSITGIAEPEAKVHLTNTDGAVKVAVLLAAGAGSVAQARALIQQSEGHLRAALAQL